MGRKNRRIVTQTPQHRQPAVDYPTLSEHRASRRRFLAGSAAVLGAGALTACGRPFWTDYQGEMDGYMPEPDYHTVRFPVTPEDRAVYLIDGGYVRFYAVAMTYHEDCAFFAIDSRAALTDQMADRITEHTYDELTTSAGVVAVQEELRLLLDEAYNDDTGDIAAGWFVDVEVTFTRMDPPEILDGFAGSTPSYP